MPRKDKVFYITILFLIILSLLEFTSIYTNLRATIKIVRIADIILFLSITFGATLMLIIDCFEPKGSRASTIFLLLAIFLLFISKCYTLYLLLS